MAAEPVEEITSFEVSPGKLVQVGANLDPETFNELCSFLKTNQDVFAWTTDDMPGISRDIAEHKLFLHPGARPVQ